MEPGGFQLYRPCGGEGQIKEDQCGKPPGLEQEEKPLVCATPVLSLSSEKSLTKLSDQNGNNNVLQKAASKYDEEVNDGLQIRPDAKQKYCIGTAAEGERCSKFTCGFGLTCSRSKDGKCVKPSWKFKDFWIHDNSRASHTSTNTYGLQYRKARDFFMQCNNEVDKTLTAFADSWAASSKLAHRMEMRICGGQVKEVIVEEIEEDLDVEAEV